MVLANYKSIWQCGFKNRILILKAFIFKYTVILPLFHLKYQHWIPKCECGFSHVLRQFSDPAGYLIIQLNSSTIYQEIVLVSPG